MPRNDQNMKKYELLAEKHNALSVIFMPQNLIARNFPKKLNFKFFFVSFTIKYSSVLISPYNCMALSVEWYRLISENRDFFALFNGNDLNFIERINFLHEYMNIYFHRKNYTEKRINPLELCQLFCKQGDNFHLSKLLGLKPKSTSAGFFSKEITGISSCVVVSKNKVIRQVTDKKNVNLIAGTIGNCLSNLDILEFKFIVYKAIDNRSNYFGHGIGITSIINSRKEIEFLFYDSDVGQFSFSQLCHLKDFILEYLQNICNLTNITNLTLCIESYNHPQPAECLNNTLSFK